MDTAKLDAGDRRDAPREEDIVNRLREAGLRPTRQRIALAMLLYGRGHRHVTAEELHREAALAGLSVSLATVYNTLNQFTRARLLREVIADGSKAFYDTNVSEHYHFYSEKDGRLIDIPGDQLSIGRLPPLPEGTRVASIDVIVRLAED
ncbi:MAG TPA: transcriptional repressor [Bryobacterales bacterium]|nr:transcriptional repressor [Bryobacterales bacterium]